MNDHSSAAQRLAFQFHITLAMAVSVLRSIVAEYGENYTYQGACVYVEGDGDGTLRAKCIVGQAFSRWGILRTLTGIRGDLGATIMTGNAVDNQPGVCNLAGFDSSVRRHLATIGITMDDEAWRFLREAQGNQDSRKPWGVSITEAAEAVLIERGETVGDPLDRLLS